MTIRRLSANCFSRRIHDFPEEENEIIIKAKKMKIATIRDMSVLEIIEYIVKITEYRPLAVTGAPSKFLKVL